MTRHDNGEAIAGHRVSHGTGRPRIARLLRKLGVRQHLSGGDSPAFFDDLSLELGEMCQVERYVAKIVRRAAGIGLNSLGQSPDERWGVVSRFGTLVERGARCRGRRVSHGELAQPLAGPANSHPAQFGRKDKRLLELGLGTGARISPRRRHFSRG